MKIAIVNKFFFLNGGQETVALEQMNLLQQAGHEVAFFAMHHPRNPADYPWSRYFVDYADFSLKNQKAGVLQKIGLASRFIHNRQAAKRFSQFLDAFKPDIVHCHGIAHQLTYSLLPEAKKRCIPIVQTLHDYQAICPSYTLLKGDGTICTDGCTPQNYLPCMQNQCVKGSRMASTLSAFEMTLNRSLFDYTRDVDQFISPSQFLAQKMMDSGLPAHKIQVIPNFLVGMEAIEPVFEDEGYYLYSGRLSHEKGLMTLLKAFQQVPQARLLIAGEGALKTQLETYCKTHHLENVTLLGYLNRDDMQACIRKAAAIILPSEWYENQPMAIIEAFAHGKPVIASQMGGIPEMITNNENGFLFLAGDSNTLAQILTQIEANLHARSLLGKRARTSAISEYNANRHLQSLLQMYESLATKAKSSSHHCPGLLKPANAVY